MIETSCKFIFLIDGIPHNYLQGLLNSCELKGQHGGLEADFLSILWFQLSILKYRGILRTVKSLAINL